MSTPAQAGSPSLRTDVLKLCGVDVARCYQCAKCSAGCPMAGEMSRAPQEIMRLVQLDRREAILGEPSIHLCLACETCSERCPNECQPARVIDALRELAGPGGAPRRIAAFHRAFLDQIRSHGRVFELGLVAAYKLRSGDLLADVASAPAMLARGKLALTPRSIRGIAEVRRIFGAFLDGQGESEG